MNGYTYISVSGQNTIGLNYSNNTLNLVASGGINLTTNSTTQTLTINTSSNFSVSDLNVTNSLTLNPVNIGSIDNVSIGSITPRIGVFSTLVATGAVTFNPANANITISPIGSGTLIINPATTGSINNVNIGSTVPAAGTFTNVTITSLQQSNAASAVTKGFATALAAAYGVALS